MAVAQGPAMARTLLMEAETLRRLIYWGMP